MKKIILLSLAILTNSLAHGYFLEPVLDRKLTEQEMKVLLPAYVASIEANIDTLPSPEDGDIMNTIQRSATITTETLRDKNGKEIGNKFRTVNEIVDELKHFIGELESLAVEERRRSTREALSGFVTFEKDSKVTCHLGYKSAYQTKSNRIVLCKDDRSVSETESPDDEGYSDVREIILSIDEDTLKPISPLRITHLTAG